MLDFFNSLNKRGIMMTMREILEKIWHEFETLLEESVLQNNYSAVERLLAYERFLEASDAKINPHRKRLKYTIPLLLAIQNAQFPIIKLFLKYNYNLVDPHSLDCRCEKCYPDRLGQTRLRLLTLKALGNAMWLSLTSDDPFLTLFELHTVQSDYMGHNDSFQKEYEEMCKENETVCLGLMDEVRSEAEGGILMGYKRTLKEQENGKELAFIDLACDYGQKEVVAHPVTQHFLSSRIFDEIPNWSTSGIVYKATFVICVALCYPITTILNIVCPTKCCGKIGDIAMQPFIKFLNGAASFITFLILLGVLGASDRTGIRTGKPPSALEIVVFIWVIGFSFGECKQLLNSGITKYLSSGWNWVDIGMDTLMLFSSTVWVVLSFYKPEDEKIHEFIMHIADGAFTVGIILSFFRIIYLCQITSYLGLLQLCLGEMVMVILQFAFVCLIVLLAYTVGMMFLFNSSKSTRQLKRGYLQKHANHTGIYASLSEKFNGFWSTMFTMMYVSLSMEDTRALEDFADGTLIHLWSTLLFIVYFAITMIVILNMLIAMMNNSYQKIADNLTTEHMYSRTNLWMEYVGDEQTRPVPFNLIPSVNGVRRLMVFVQNKCLHRCNEERRRKSANLEVEAKRKYKQLCHLLLKRYIRKKWGIGVEVHPTEPNTNDPLLAKIKKQFEIWRKAQDEDQEEPGEEESGTESPQTSSFIDHPDAHDNQVFVADKRGEITGTENKINDFLVL